MYKRHDLVWLTRDGWQAALGAHPEHESVLNFWRSEEWPTVVRRGDTDSDPAHEVCVGIALPPDAEGVKRRIALRVPLEHVEKCSAPLTLKAARAALPEHWRRGYTRLQELSTGLDLRVYGSLAWQAVTGLPAITATSDIDILFRPVSSQQLHAGLALLDEARHGLPLDGEVMFPSGQAVSWKEWLSAGAAGARVLVKDMEGVRLAATDKLLATLRPA
ncbi:malonate decarboxylase holo-[acyl-carrier-protein] synthase [Pseudoduganella sp. LjRoot289]|uniref:malonate decarboxylase holo-[acyl-carrier-protein] synthase n=1 Tax=Pseudoduganella sp. LjRoot289 TaxID=3342314 RepID=UPI003ECFBF5D